VRVFLKRGFSPRLEAVGAKVGQRRHNFLFADAQFALCQRRAVNGFHVASHFIVALLGGLADELAVPHEFIPVDAARAALTTIAAHSIRPFFVATAFVNHFDLLEDLARILFRRF
jgi:hypothetical protein